MLLKSNNFKKYILKFIYAKGVQLSYEIIFGDKNPSKYEALVFIEKGLFTYSFLEIFTVTSTCVKRFPYRG